MTSVASSICFLPVPCLAERTLCTPEKAVVEEKGNHEDDREIDRQRAATYLQMPGDTKVPPMGIDDLTTEHMANWLSCMRSRQAPHATIAADPARFNRTGRPRRRVPVAGAESSKPRPTGSAPGLRRLGPSHPDPILAGLG